jgi:hypothetical protein
MWLTVDKKRHEVIAGLKDKGCKEGKQNQIK